MSRLVLLLAGMELGVRLLHVGDGQTQVMDGSDRWMGQTDGWVTMDGSDRRKVREDSFEVRIINSCHFDFAK